MRLLPARILPALCVAAIFLGLLACAPGVDLERLIAESDSEDLDARMEAREKLADLVKTKQVEPFARGLKSENPEIRIQAMFHLLAVNTPEASEALIGELAFSRRMSIFYNPIRMVPSSKASDSRIMVANILLMNGGHPRAVEVLSRDFGHEPDVDARKATVYALGALRDPKAVPFLKKALRDPEMDVVQAALDGLNQIQTPDIGQLLAAGLSDPLETVRRNSAVAMRGYPGKETVSALFEAVGGDTAPGIRVLALEAIGYAGSLDDFSPVLSLLRDPGAPPDLKDQAAKTLRLLSGQDFGRDAAKWARWEARHRAAPARR